LSLKGQELPLAGFSKLLLELTAFSVLRSCLANPLLWLGLENFFSGEELHHAGSEPMPGGEVLAVVLAANGLNPHPVKQRQLSGRHGLESLPCQLLAEHLSNEFAPVPASSNQPLHIRFDQFFIYTTRTGGRHDGRVRI